MTHEMLFIIASLILAVAVIVGANVWALKDPPDTELQRSLSKGIEELLTAADRSREPDRAGDPLTPGHVSVPDGRCHLVEQQPEAHEERTAS